MEKVNSAAEALARLDAVCHRRGYNAEVMLGLARALSVIEFSRVNGYWMPVWRGKVLLRGRQRAEKKTKMEAR